MMDVTVHGQEIPKAQKKSHFGVLKKCGLLVGVAFPINAAENVGMALMVNGASNMQLCLLKGANYDK